MVDTLEHVYEKLDNDIQPVLSDVRYKVGELQEEITEIKQGIAQTKEMLEKIADEVRSIKILTILLVVMIALTFALGNKSVMQALQQVLVLSLGR